MHHQLGFHSCQMVINLFQTESKGLLQELFFPTSYEERLTLLNIPTLSDFIFDLSKRHFNNIVSEPEHPLFSRVIRSTVITSSRLNTVFRPKICKTQKCARSLFQTMMSHFNTIQPQPFYFYTFICFCFFPSQLIN